MSTRIVGRDREGFTLLEVLAASLIASFVAGGTLMAFVTAARLSRFQNSGHYAEAATLAQETFERFRNRVAADDNFFAQAANPGANNIPNNNGWICDGSSTVPGGDRTVNGWKLNRFSIGSGGTESILAPGAKARRCYRVRPAECDGHPGISPQGGDCYAMTVQVCWNDEQVSCNCPQDGDC